MPNDTEATTSAPDAQGAPQAQRTFTNTRGRGRGRQNNGPSRQPAEPRQGGNQPGNHQAKSAPPKEFPQPKATSKQTGKPNSPLVENSIVKDAIFAPTSIAIEKTALKKTNVDLSSFMSLIEEAYRVMSLDKKTAKSVPIEAWRYYCVALLWTRIIELKAQSSVHLTQEESDWKQMMESTPVVIPKPLQVFFNSLGAFQTINGEKFSPAFPTLPVNTPDGYTYGGFFPMTPINEIPADPINNQPHVPALLGPSTPNFVNLAIAIPSLGLCVENLLRLFISPLVPQWTPAFAGNLQPTSNLLGFAPTRQPEKAAINNLYSWGLAPGIFLEDIPTTAISIPLLIGISTCLSQLASFAIETATISTLSPLGTRAQLVLSQPASFQAIGRLYADGEFQSLSLNKEDNNTFAISSTFTFVLYREPSANDHHTWYPYTGPIDQRNIDERNARIDIGPTAPPSRFRTDPQFMIVPIGALEQRRLLVESLKTKT